VIWLDTHSLIWWVNEAKRLSPSANAAIDGEAIGGRILVSSISAWEMAFLVKGGRISFAGSIPSWRAQVRRFRALEFIPVDNEIGIAAVDLPGAFHNDPADRVIVARARKFGAPIITADEKIRGYRHARTIW
jgi:PIN domain nuclease of toxin-antitoxin system